MAERSGRAPTNCSHGKSMTEECLHCDLRLEREWERNLRRRLAKAEARIATIEAALAAGETP